MNQIEESEEKIREGWREITDYLNKKHRKFFNRVEEIKSVKFYSKGTGNTISVKIILKQELSEYSRGQLASIEDQVYDVIWELVKLLKLPCWVNERIEDKNGDVLF